MLLVVHCLDKDKAPVVVVADVAVNGREDYMVVVVAQL